MANRKSVITVCGAAIAMFVVAASSYAFIIVTKENHVTFNQTVALPGVTLAGGTYIFEELSPTSPNVVRVLSRDRSRVYLTAFTAPTQRPAGMPMTVTMSLGEATAGTATPITAWYPIGQSTGHRFIYDTAAR